MPQAGGGAVVLSAVVPAGVAALCRSMAVVGTEPPPDMIALDAGAIGAALARFGARFRQPDRHAVASLWSMYYFNALIVPTAAVLLVCDRIVPVMLPATGLALDGKGLPERLYIADDGRPAFDADRGKRFKTLVDGHLTPFIAMYAERTSLSPRLLWSNAATVLDYVVGTVATGAHAAPRAEAESLLAGTSPDAFPHLADPFRTAPDGTRERRICCTRHRLSGVAPCPTLCPGRDAYMGINGAGARRHWPDDAG